MDEKEPVAIAIYKAMFSDQKTVEIGGEIYKIHKTKSGLRNLNYKGIWYIEQNPNKNSSTAKLVREGHQLLWGIRGRTYVLKVLDGKYEQLR